VLVLSLCVMNVIVRVVYAFYMCMHICAFLFVCMCVCACACGGCTFVKRVWDSSRR